MTTERQIRWKKINGGILTLADGTMVRKNETFVAGESEVPKVFRSSVIPIDTAGNTVALVTEEELMQESKNYFEIEAVGTGRQKRYNVMNMASGKVVNSKPLSKNKAEELLDQLS